MCEYSLDLHLIYPGRFVHQAGFMCKAFAMWPHDTSAMRPCAQPLPPRGYATTRPRSSLRPLCCSLLGTIQNPHNYVRSLMSLFCSATLTATLSLRCEKLSAADYRGLLELFHSVAHQHRIPLLARTQWPCSGLQDSQMLQ